LFFFFCPCFGVAKKTREKKEELIGIENEQKNLLVYKISLTEE